MAAVLHQRAQVLAQNPGNAQAIDAVAQEINQLRQNLLPPEQQAQVEEAFLFLAQARQMLEYAQPLVNRVDEVRPPIPAYEEQLIQPLPQRRVAAQDRPGLGAPALPPDPPRPLAPAQNQPPALTHPAAQPQNRPAATRPSSEPNLLERIWAAVSGAIKTIIQFLASFLCCATPTQQPTQTNRPPAPPVTQPAPQPQQQPPQPIQQPPAPLQPPVAPQILAEGTHQPIAHLVGTINTTAVGGAPVAANCANEMFVQLWDALGRRENLSTPGRAAELIDASLRLGAPKADYPRILPVQLAYLLGDLQQYMPQIQALELHAFRNPNHMTGAILSKGEERHLLLIDGRNRQHYRYYHFDPKGNNNPAYLEICDRAAPFAAHLNQSVPIAAGEPFTLRAFTVRAAQ